MTEAQPIAGHLLAPNIDHRRLWPKEKAPVIVISARVEFMPQRGKGRHALCEWCGTTCAKSLRVPPYDYKGSKPLADAGGGWPVVVEEGAGMLESVRALSGLGPIHVSSRGFFDDIQRPVWACSDECERHLLHGAGLSPDAAGLR